MMMRMMMRRRRRMMRMMRMRMKDYYDQFSVPSGPSKTKYKKLFRRTFAQFGHDFAHIFIMKFSGSSTS